MNGIRYGQPEQWHLKHQQKHNHRTSNYPRHTCAATLNPVLSLFIDLNTELTLRLSVSRFLVTVLTATCHTCELQFRARGLFRTDFLVNEYGHSSSNLSRICRWMSDSTMHSVSDPGSQHSSLPMKLNRRRIMTAEICVCDDFGTPDGILLNNRVGNGKKKKNLFGTARSESGRETSNKREYLQKTQ